MKPKYWISLLVCFAMWAYFRREHAFTVKTWAFLVGAHLPFLLVMLALEKKKAVSVHPIVCFLVVWMGGIAGVAVLGRLLGPGVRA
jgi:hypothetical protein